MEQGTAAFRTVGQLKPLGAAPEEPANHYRLAVEWGEMVARQQMSEQLALAYCKTLSGYNANWDYTEPPVINPFYVRLATTMRNTATETLYHRARAERFIRKAVRPLIRNNASKAEVEEAAGKANAGVLDWQDIFPILRDEFLRAR